MTINTTMLCSIRTTSRKLWGSLIGRCAPSATRCRISARHWPIWVDSTDPEELQENRWGPPTHRGSLTREQIVHYYSEKTGCDASPIAFYLAFARFKLAV